MTKHTVEVEFKCRKQDVTAINAYLLTKGYGPNNLTDKVETFPVDSSMLTALQYIANTFTATTLKFKKRKDVRNAKRLGKQVKELFDKPVYKPGGSKADVTLEF